MRGPHNRFKVGDRVKSFRGEIAIVRRLEESRNYRSKSHRVEVEWIKPPRGIDNRSYYEEVFELCSEES